MVPWSRLEALIQSHYPKGNGRPPMPLGTMLRIHFMQQWFGYSDPAMDEDQWHFGMKAHIGVDAEKWLGSYRGMYDRQCRR